MYSILSLGLHGNRQVHTLHGASSTRRFSENFDYTNDFNLSYQIESPLSGGFLSSLIGTSFKTTPKAAPKYH